jgi:hypothetical protein
LWGYRVRVRVRVGRSRSERNYRGDCVAEPKG